MRKDGPIPMVSTPPTETTTTSDLSSDVALPPAGTTVTTRLELPTRTIAKVILTLAVLWLVGRLWTLLLLLFVALLLTAALDPIVSRLERRGWPRSLSVTLILALLVAAIALLGLVLVPPLVEQGSQLYADLPTYADRAQDLVNANPELVERIRGLANQGTTSPTAVVSGFVAAGANLVQGVANLLILLVLTIYLLVDGERVVDWVLRYLPLGQRTKVRRALPEISRVVSGYVVGQVLTSVLFGVFAFAVLAPLGVPQPLLLALVAALMDAVPIAGILLATIPAVLLALTVSLPTAGIVLAAYVAYQQVENYLIVPRVYRGTLQISSFAVLVAVLVGGQLLGIVGVLLALPIAAAIPVIERIWRHDPNAGETSA